MGTASRRGTNVDGRRFPVTNGEPICGGFCEDLHLFAGLSGTEDFFELWEEKQISVVSIFDGEDVRDSFQRTDFKTYANSGILKQNALGHSDGEDYASLRQGGSRKIRL